MTDWRRIAGLTYGEARWLLTAVVLLAYELVAVFAPKSWGIDVLTRAYRVDAPRWVIFPVGIGIIMGHLHGAILPGSGIIGRWSPALFITFAAAVLARDLFIRDRIPEAAVFPLFLFSVALGALSWRGAP